ncbi:MAG: hypothetical protein RLZZ272_287 [Actinomycetota bacterium]
MPALPSAKRAVGAVRGGSSVGERVDGASLSPEGRAAETARLERELSRLHALVAAEAFEDRAPLVGIEVELDLIDEVGGPAPVAERVLAALHRDAPGLDAQHELARYNLELNLPPRPLAAGLLDALERDLARGLAEVAAAADGIAAPIAIGILPTIGTGEAGVEVLSGGDRYRLLDEAVRGGRAHLPITIEGPAATGGERLELSLPSIALEAAATSLQVHLDAPIARLAATLDAAQAITPALVAVAANSPLLCGSALWHETRVPLFEQVIDLRDAAGIARGDRPRVWFGERWHEHAIDAFDENVRHFPPLLPQREPEDDPVPGGAGPAPALAALRLHNGTVWRWNRPVYAVVDGRPTLRLEHRALPAGPTPIDMVANVALLVGAVSAIASGSAEDLLGGRLEERLAFADVEAGFRTAARDGLDAALVWPGLDGADAARVVLEVLVPAAERGLADAGLSTTERDRLLDVVAARAATRRTGSAWQLRMLRRLEDSMDRDRALGRLTRRYLELQGEGSPVHTWPTT